MKIVKEWYAWVPNLSGDIFLSDIKIVLNEKNFSVDKNGVYSRLIQISDISTKHYNFTITISPDFSNSNNENKLFVELKEIKIKAECVIERNGLLQLKLNLEEDNDNEFSEGICRTIYHELRNIFHEHTHHAEEADRLLDAIQAETRKDAIEKIVRLYLKKIFYYHHFLKEYLSQSYFKKYMKKHIKALFDWKIRDFKQPSIEYAVQAEGEMLYALLFIKLFKEDLGENKFKEYQFIFNNAYLSFTGISHKIGQILQDYANKIMSGLTVILVILTVLMVFFEL